MAARTKTARPLAARALVLALGVAVLTALALPSWALLNVPLHGAHVGASSLTFNWGSNNGGLSDPVVWHFVLNGMDRGTAPAQLTVTFQNAGTRTVTAANSGQTQHFFVGTPGHDVLTGGFAVTASSRVNNLVLSHVWYDRSGNPGDDPDDPVDPGDDPDDPADPGDDPDDPVDPGDGEDPGDDPDDPVDPGDDPDDPADPGDGEDPGDPEDPGDGGEDTTDGEQPEDFLPFTEQDTDDEPDFLPYTGVELALLLTAAGTSAAAGAWIRRRNRVSE